MQNDSISGYNKAEFYSKTMAMQVDHSHSFLLQPKCKFTYLKLGLLLGLGVSEYLEFKDLRQNKDFCKHH